MDSQLAVQVASLHDTHAESTKLSMASRDEPFKPSHRSALFDQMKESEKAFIDTREGFILMEDCMVQFMAVCRSSW